MKSTRPHRNYNWGANYTRIDGEMIVLPPLHKLLLCVRVVERMTGYQVGSDFFSFVEYSKSLALGQELGEATPVYKSKLILTLDMWHGHAAPWQHAHTGYCGFYKIPEVGPTYWHSGNGFELDKFHMVYLNVPSLLETQGYDRTEPGIYLAQSYTGSDGFANWAIHHPGYRWQSTGEFCFPPSWYRVPDVSAEYWLPLPDLSCPLSFR